MSGSNAWADSADVFRRTREAYLEHENAKAELKGLMPEDAKEAIGQQRSTRISRASTVHTVSTIGIDMGKSTLHMIGLDSSGAIVLREKISRGRIASRFANLRSCLIGIEAGSNTLCCP
jgi:hypothetical protein